MDKSEELDRCPNCEEVSKKMHDSYPWWVCQNPACPVIHFNKG